MPENEMPVDPIADLSAAEIIRLLDLQPHPRAGISARLFAIHGEIRGAGPSRR